MPFQFQVLHTLLYILFFSFFFFFPTSRHGVTLRSYIYNVRNKINQLASKEYTFFIGQRESERERERDLIDGVLIMCVCVCLCGFFMRTMMWCTGWDQRVMKLHCILHGAGVHLLTVPDPRDQPSTIAIQDYHYYKALSLSHRQRGQKAFEKVENLQTESFLFDPIRTITVSPRSVPFLHGTHSV